MKRLKSALMSVCMLAAVLLAAFMPAGAAMAAAAHKSLQDFFMAQLSFLENSSGEKNEIISLICQN